MRRTPWPRLVLLAAVAAAVGLAALRVAESRGATLLPVPAVAVAVVVLIAALVLSAGWSVRQYTRGKRPGLDPLVAARTVVLATAAAWTGALLSGWYAAQVLLVLADLEIEARRDLAVSAGAALLATVALCAVGLLVERWCQVQPPEDDGPDPASAASGSPV